MVSDIPAEKYKDLYVYGVGMIDVEFSKDLYAAPKNLDGVITSTRDDTIEPAIEIALHEAPRNIERTAEDVLIFKDIKPYLQMGRNFAVVKREDWSYKSYEYRDDIPGDYDSYLNKRMVIVLSNTARSDIEI